jgi:hypothetical protein
VRDELQRLTSSESPATAVANWCNDYVHKYIGTFIDQHDEPHDGFLRDLEEAKR